MQLLRKVANRWTWRSFHQSVQHPAAWTEVHDSARCSSSIPKLTSTPTTLKRKRSQTKPSLFHFIIWTHASIDVANVHRWKETNEHSRHCNCTQVRQSWSRQGSFKSLRLWNWNRAKRQNKPPSSWMRNNVLPNPLPPHFSYPRKSLSVFPFRL